MRVCARLTCGVLVLLAMCLAPARAFAAPFLFELATVNSELHFGGPAFSDHGYDVTSLAVRGVDVDVFQDWDASATDYEASGGTLVRQTLNTDGSGAVESSTYRYEGGLFVVTLHLTRPGETRSGTFTAPIESLEFTAPEPGRGGAFSMWYDLGPGTFSAAFAAAFGIPVHAGPGYVDVPLIVLLNDAGHTSTTRIAHDGGGMLNVYEPAAVPEPWPGAITVMGLAAALGVRTRRRAGPSGSAQAE